MIRRKHLIVLFAFSCLTACDEAQEQALLYTSAAVSGHSVKNTPKSATNIVFQSADGGKTWQDMSTGLPLGFEPRTFFAGDGELFLSAKHGVYRNVKALKNSIWGKEQFLMEDFVAVSAVPNGVVAYTNNCRFFQKVKGVGVWMPAFTGFRGQFVRTVFTANDGSIFIGCDNGLFKSADQGESWKHVMQQGWVIKMAESDGVLLCTNESGILRSTDGGEHWSVVLSEGGVGIDVDVTKSGFAAITYNTESKTRRVRTSADGGKTWQAIDAGLPPSPQISSIQQVGDYFYCGHPKGIYRSADQGKTWELILPTIGDKVFNLSASGDVVYAVLQNGGC